MCIRDRDQTGVGKLVKMAAQLGRETRADLHLGICGEHGGDPSSVEFCHKVGLDYVDVYKRQPTDTPPPIWQTMRFSSSYFLPTSLA